MDCLPAKKPICVVDLTKNTDKGILNREDMKRIVPLFGNLDSFKEHFRKILKNKNVMHYGIPQSIIDDFYYKLDGNTSDRICEFVLTKVGSLR